MAGAERRGAKRKGPVLRALGFLFEVIDRFSRDRCPLLAAAMAYFMGFALPSVLVFIILILGFFVDPDEIRGTIFTNLRNLIGAQGAQQVQAIVRNANRLVQGDTSALLLGIATMLFAATGVFLSLQASLNIAWGVRPDPKQGGVRVMLVKRLFSLLMTLIVAVFILLSLVLSAVLTAFGSLLNQALPAGVSAALLHGVNWLVSIVLFTLLFAVIFRLLPDASIAWRDVWVGALVTTFLFLLGKTVAGLYLARSSRLSIFGAAGSFVVVLLWIYITAMILLFGAEFIQVWIRRHGRTVLPEPGAVQLRTELRRIRSRKKKAD